MGWTRSSGRVARDRRRPGLEGLEIRQLLSRMSLEVAPVASISAVKNSDGSTNFDRIIGASATRSAFGVDGTGSNVAVIDTGVNYDHSILGAGLGPGNKVVAGVDFTGSPKGALPTWQHGTGVAGIVAANAPNYQGVAPGAGIVALRVFDAKNQGSFANIEKALDWVVQHHDEYQITAVNVSISDGGNYQANEFAHDGGVGQAITGTIQRLDSMNIPVVVAAGNSFDGKTQGEGFPASVPGAISVTATDSADKLASNAQRLGAIGGGSATTIAAPGVGITAPGDGNNLTTEDGTSFAAPQVTGGIVLLQQIYEKAFQKPPTVAQLESLLRQGARTIHDDTSNINIGRLDLLNSAEILRQQIASLLGTNPVGNGNSSPGAGSAVSSDLHPAAQVMPVLAPSPVPPPPVQSPAVQAPVVQPQTDVFYNGIRVGSYSTAQLSSRYSNLFGFLKSPVGSIRIYGPKGSVPDLGKSQPSGSVVHLTSASPRPASGHSKAVSHGTAASQAVQKSKVAVHKPVAHPKHSSFFSTLFPFKF